MKQLLYRYNPWWENVNFPMGEVFARDAVLIELENNFLTKDIVFLSGLRRVGKTTIIKLFIKQLIEKKDILPKFILYVSLDDYLLNNNSMFEIIDEFRKINGLSFGEKIYLFFDEVTYFADYQQQLKNLYDSHNVKIFAASSSSSLLKAKKPYLTGRSRIIEVLPLNFEEYLIFKNIHVKKSDTHLIDKYFEDFLQTGGIPEYVLRNDLQYLRDLVDDIIIKDIAAPNAIKNINILKEYFLLLMERAGKSISLNKTAKILGVSADTAKRYLSYFEESYLISVIPRYGKTNETILSPKKVYSSDLGIKNAFIAFRDKGSIFENYIFQQIKTYDPCYFYQAPNELDFVINKNILIESKYFSTLTIKQKELFNSLQFEYKYLITNYSQLEEALKQIKSIMADFN
ncbi:MAG: ATP-binding protein [bacterium]